MRFPPFSFVLEEEPVDFRLLYSCLLVALSTGSFISLEE